MREGAPSSVTPIVRQTLSKVAGGSGGGGGAARAILLLAAPADEAPFQHIERKGSGVQHRVVEAPHVEEPTQLLPRPLPQLQDLQLPDLVRERLRRHGDVAVGLHLYVELVDGRVRVEEIDDLLPVPALRVQSGVDDETDRAEHLVLETPEVAVGVLVEADLLAEPLGVERPALDERGVEGLLADRRQALELLRDRDLEVVAGD